MLAFLRNEVVSRIASIKDFDVGYPLAWQDIYNKKKTGSNCLKGYSDGYPRALSNKAKVLVNGKRCT